MQNVVAIDSTSRCANRIFMEVANETFVALQHDGERPPMRRQFLANAAAVISAFRLGRLAQSGEQIE
jgi:hypothetical protein